MIWKKRLFIILFSFVAFCLSFFPVFGQQKEKAPGQGTGRPLSEILNPDGTLKLGEGIQGSFDPTGFRMVSGLGGQPRFVPAASGPQTQGDAFLTAAGDENWDSQFGALFTNSDVYAIAVSGADVYVGGVFTDAGGIAGADYIARWNGSSWSALGTGLNSWVWAIAVSGTDVYVGGVFTDAGGTAGADCIARWNGSSWSALGTGLTGSVRAIAVSGADVYVGGGFTNAGGIAEADYIARWNGSSWSALGTGLTGDVQAIAVSGTDVYVGGWFTDAGGVTAANIAKWNGSNWSALGNGLNSYVYAIAVSGTDVYVGGHFTTAGGVAPKADFIAKWNGSSWSALGSGLNYDAYAIAVSGTIAYVGGAFSQAGGHQAYSIAKWDIASNTWPAMGSGLNGYVYAVAQSGTDVYVGGWFTDAGGVTAANIAKWNGSNWSALGNGLNGYVYAIVVSGTDVYVGGSFTQTGNGSQILNRITKWGGSGWSALGSGLNNDVRAIALSGTDVYVGGYFTQTGDGSQTLNHIAKWDGGSWSALGSGLSSDVSAIAVSGSDIYVGGYFVQTDDGSQALNRIAKWNGSGWSALGNGLNGWVYAIAVSGTDVYAGGPFTQTGDGSQTLNRIAKWNGSSWSALGSGLNSSVHEIAVSGTDVYVGGQFLDAGGIAEADRIARWNGSSWSALGSGINTTVYAIAVSGTEIYVGGEFTMTGGKPSYYFGRWMTPLTLTSPNGGEVWEAGSVRAITWKGTTSTPNVAIWYQTGYFPGYPWRLIVDPTPNDGTFDWTIPDTFSSTCLVAVTDSGGGDRYDGSDAYFTIAGFHVTSPNGGESWIAGSPQTITWDSGGDYTTVQIELSTNNGSTWTTITSGTTNAGNYPWTVPGMISSQCLIKVSDSADGFPSDTNDAVFSIVPVPSLTVISPNGGEKWTMGTSQNITWTSTGASANVKIEYSTDSGANYSLITASTANDGTQPWSVPFMSSSACLVKVSDVASPSLFDVSNAAFSIVPIPDKRLTYTSGFSGSPAIAVQSANKLHVVWEDNTTGNFELYYKKSTDAGATWTAAKKLTSAPGSSARPAIAVDTSGRIHLVWESDKSGHFDIYYKKSTDGGATWTADKRLSWTTAVSMCPALWADSLANLHAVWYDDTPGNAEIYYTQSKDKGATWAAAKRLTWTTGLSVTPVIAADSSGRLHVVWRDDSSGNAEIYYKKSSNRGTTWETNKRLTWTSGSSEVPAIGVDSSGYLHVVWVDNTPGNTEIYYKKSTDAGVTWSTNKRLTTTVLSSYSPDLALDSSNRLHLIWVDETPGNREIYYRKSIDMGATWITNRRLTWTIGSSSGPAIGVDTSGNLHVVWEDNTPGNYEIYYKKFK